MSSSSTEQLASGKLLLDEPLENVLRIRISNPDKRGALDHEILDTLAETLWTHEQRCVVITGDGPVFSAGYDIGNFDDPEMFSAAAEKLVAHPFTDAIRAIEYYRYPVIAAINGHAIGGGLELAVSCDIRIAASNVKLGMPPAKIGLIYSHTGLRKFLEVCGPANTSELFFVGRYVGAERAYDMGLVNQVVDGDELEEAVLSMAGEIAGNAPLSLVGNKEIMRVLREVPSQLTPDAERRLIEYREAGFRTEDFREGVNAFAEKRTPEWKGR
ncbi:MAG: enoyl-CoA hydratase/isomerase family protein [Thermoleophilaceae bacterium]